MHRFLIGILGITLSLLTAAPLDYSNTIKTWQEQRNEGLRKPDSWLTLVGLFWLNPGQNTIGSGEYNDIVLPPDSSPERVGSLLLKDGKVEYQKSDGTSEQLSSDPENPTVVKTGSVSFYVIERGGKFAVRAKDSESAVRRNFRGMKYFPVDPAFRFAAKFTPDEKMIPIVNILGQTEQEKSPGIVEFAYQGKTYRLRPIFEGKTLYFLFKDATNRSQTYQAGRMLNTPLPENGKVDLDFNRSYNPPCTFTPYATCPLPPRENTLPFEVKAGELRYGKGHPELSARR
jgi:uncharacterized protein